MAFHYIIAIIFDDLYQKYNIEHIYMLIDALIVMHKIVAAKQNY